MKNQHLHDQDFYAWANEQAALLRAGRLSEADIEHIAEEIESMGKTEKRELVSRLTILLLHLLKCNSSQAFAGHPGASQLKTRATRSLITSATTQALNRNWTHQSSPRFAAHAGKPPPRPDWPIRFSRRPAPGRSTRQWTRISGLTPDSLPTSQIAANTA